jgi:xanthine dehydrogenase accessory factor
MKSVELHAKIAGLAREGTPFVVATIIDVKGSSPRGVGAKMLVTSDGAITETIGGGVLEKRVIADALTFLAAGVTRSERYELREQGENALGALCGGEATVFFEVHAPLRTLLIIGAGHVGQKLSSFAKLLDFRVVVLDSRDDVVTGARFPDADQLICGDPGRAADLFAIGETTHVVIVTHGHLHDKDALRAVIGSAAASIGMIGSANKVRAIFAQLRDEGVSAESLEGIHAPIGLDIGAETPAELALCIMAEIVAVGGGKLEGRTAPSLSRAPVVEGDDPR